MKAAGLDEAEQAACVRGELEAKAASLVAEADAEIARVLAESAKRLQSLGGDLQKAKVDLDVDSCETIKAAMSAEEARAAGEVDRLQKRLASRTKLASAIYDAHADKLDSLASAKTQVAVALSELVSKPGVLDAEFEVTKAERSKELESARAVKEADLRRALDAERFEKAKALKAELEEIKHLQEGVEPEAAHKEEMRKLVAELEVAHREAQAEVARLQEELKGLPSRSRSTTRCWSPPPPGSANKQREKDAKKQRERRLRGEPPFFEKV